MNNYNYSAVGGNLPGWLHTPASFVLLIIIIGWSIVWKGLALWHAARKGQGWWFVILTLVNSIGILEIIYLFLVAKVKLSELFSKK